MTSCTPQETSSSSSSPNKVNLLQLATTCIYSTLLASQPIQQFKTNSRTKHDGSLVTDADGAAQAIIYSQIQKYNIKIVGEESELEMQRESYQEYQDLQLLQHVEQIMNLHSINTIEDSKKVAVIVDPLDGTSAYAKGNYEAVTILVAIIVENIPVFGVICKPFRVGTDIPSFDHSGCSVIYGGTLLNGAFVMTGLEEYDEKSQPQELEQQQEHYYPLGRMELIRSKLHKQEQLLQDEHEDGSQPQQQQHSDSSSIDNYKAYRRQMKRPSPTCIAEGASSSSDGHTSASSLLSNDASITIMPLTQNNHQRMDSSSSIPSPPITTVNSPPLSEQKSLNDSLTSSILNTPTISENSESIYDDPPLLRAIISKSKGGGVVQQCIDSLASKQLIHSDPLYITGAGYKTMKLVLGEQNEGLWFFPKPGTSLWDVAAADALLRVMGGRITDGFGKNLDYSKGRLEADNKDGIIACCDEKLHQICLELYEKESWGD